MILYENDWKAMNNLLLKMYSEKTDSLFEGELMKQLRYLIPYDKASFYLHNHGSDAPILSADDIDIMGFDPDTYGIFIPMVISGLPHSWTNFYERSIVIRDSDVIEDENERMKNEYFKTLYSVADVLYGLTISLAHSGTRVGILTLFRCKDKDDFSAREIEIAEHLMDHIACYAYNIYSIDQAKTHRNKSKTIASIVKQYGITERETDVLRLALVGLPIKEISNRLSISETTTKKHLSNIYNKLNIHSKAELINVLELNLEL